VTGALVAAAWLLPMVLCGSVFGLLERYDARWLEGITRRH
jgi:hypothetical protein